MPSQHVLIVDDEPLVRELVGRLFRRAGFQARTCAGGEQCLAALREGWRGVILMDVNMPRPDGWQTIRAIVDEGLYEGNLILMLTARGQPDRDLTGLTEYVVDYITKPFDQGALVATVRAYAGMLSG